VDENIPYGVIKRLRGAGAEIISVLEEFRGMSDEKIMKISSGQRDWRTVWSYFAQDPNEISRLYFQDAGMDSFRVRDKI
jgi:hypothetical protein